MCALFMGGLINFYSIHQSRLSYKRLAWNYMEDLALAYGRQVENLLGQGGSFDSGVLEHILMNANLEGVESSYTYIVDSEGNMLYHPNKDKIGKSVENVIVKGYIQDLKSGIKHDTGVVEYDYNGSIKYAACYTDENGRFILVVSADDDDVLKDSASLIVKVTAISLIIGMAAIVVVFIFIRKIVAPLSYAANAVEELAALDFRVKNERQERRFAGLKDEVGNIMRAVLKLRGELTAVVTELKNQSGNLFEQSDSLSKSASDTMNNMKDTDRAVDEMANGATMLAQETQSASENVIEIGNMIDKVNDNTEELAKDADNMKELGENAENILRQLIAGQKEMVTHIGVVNDKTHEANKAAGKISEVVNLITEIASQTNLLSLNASIEAARAGEAGRGFAVVAENIKQLAEQTTSSAADIQDIIHDLEQKSGETVEKTEAVNNIVNKQSEDMKQTADILNQVITGITGLIDKIDSIAVSVANMDKSKENVVDVIGNLSSVSQENAASTEETSASTTMAMETAKKIADEAVKLKDIAQELEDRMKQFIIQ
ncbi:MAG TPA: methyl-accepting chemotaxis protein [Eubacterium sp.]|nr:methyl-accepting chemotaxis protein [Eubacterium sp.]